MKKIILYILSLVLAVQMGNNLTYASNIEPYNFDYKNSDVTITQTNGNSKGVFTINNCNASKFYKFKFNLNPGESLITARDYLGEDFDTGEVFVIDAYNKIKQVINKPWAIDSNGSEILTYFNVSENILTQTVEHSCNNSFPITADPNAWQVTVCIASIGGVLASLVVPAAKIIQIKKAIKIVGGLSVFAQMLIGLIVGTHSLTTIAIAFGPLVVQAFTTILGIDGIMKNCAG